MGSDMDHVKFATEGKNRGKGGKFVFSSAGAMVVGVVAGIVSTAGFRCDSLSLQVVYTASHFYTTLMVTMIE